MMAHNYTLKSCGKRHNWCTVCNPVKRRRGEHPAWRTGRLLRLNHGYVWAYFLSRWIQSHRLAYVYYTGIHNIPRDWHVHHVNGDRLDNRRENLELLTNSEHQKLHRLRGV